METSDSEYFESADEDLQSDEEHTISIASVIKTNELTCDSKKSTIPQLKTLEVTTNSIQETDDISPNNRKDISKIKIDKSHSENEDSVTTKKDLKEPVRAPELDNVTKLFQGTKITEDISQETTKSGTITNKTVFDHSNSDNKDDSKTDFWDESELDWVTGADKPKTQEKCNIEDSGTDLWDESEIDWAKEKDDSNMWNNDDWEPIEPPESEKSRTKVAETVKSQAKPKEQAPSENTSWGSWGNWGVSSILSSATNSVSSITQGITTVLESGIGVPDPEELARINKAEKEKIKETEADEKDNTSTGFGLGNLVMGVSQFTKLVESTGTKVISGGLDTLETIGKKTMEVLQEGDPGLKKKRAFLKIDQDKPVLSQLLREAKEKAEHENTLLEQKHFAKKAKNFETLFDDHQGLVHLEALEMLSRQCDIKLQTLLDSYTGESLTEMQETMDQVKELCELPDEDEEEQVNWTDISDKLTSAVSEINIPISYKKLIDMWEETEIWLNNLKMDICDERELHQQAIETLAQLTAIAVEQFHKTGELLLVKEHRSTADEADSLVQLTTTLTSLIGIVAAKFSDKLNAKSSSSKNKESINGLITNIFFEAANSSSYIQDAFQLLVPVLQVGAV